MPLSDAQRLIVDFVEHYNHRRLHSIVIKRAEGKKSLLTVKWFRPIHAEPIQWKLARFPAILNEFWNTLQMEEIWQDVKTDYLAECRRYDFDKSQRNLDALWNYLRQKRKDSFVLISVPNLLDRHYQAIGSQFENYWVMVESPGAGSHALNVHEYLHSIINPMVETHYGTYRKKLDAYHKAGKGKPLSGSYNRPSIFTYESLIRALDYRLRVLWSDDPKVITQLENKVTDMPRKGLTLIDPFYQLLPEYEQSGKNFEEFLPELLDRLPKYSR